MKGINHLVLAGHDLDGLRDTYSRLGFTLTPRGQHPFGTGNTIIQLHGSYLELLAVTIPAHVPEHGADEFSFAAFNRDYLARHEGISMLVLDTEDAAADIANWSASGLRTYAPFDFSRPARMADGQEVTVAFSLAFVSNPVAPWLGLFACQHRLPGYYAQPDFLKHPNGAEKIEDVWVTGEGALGLATYFSAVVGAKCSRQSADVLTIQTRTGRIVLASPAAFEVAFGVPAPQDEDGPRLAGMTIACQTMEYVAKLALVRARNRIVVPPEKGFGTAIGFRELGSGQPNSL